MSEESILREVSGLVAAVLAFLDTDMVYGPEHKRTLAAKAALRHAFEQIAESDAGRENEPFHVLRGARRALGRSGS